jgi:hypothetical protein
MPKKKHDRQQDGYEGEDFFQFWATKNMQWIPQKPTRDLGIDFICQLPGNRTESNSSEMPGTLLSVLVRSVKSDSKSVSIDQNEAELFFSTNAPMILALVRRTQNGIDEVAIRFPDRKFIEEMDGFLKSKFKTHKVKFSEAITDIKDIHQNLDQLLRQPYEVYIKHLLDETQLKKYSQELKVESLYTEEGHQTFVYPQNRVIYDKITQNTELQKLLIDRNLKLIPFSFSAIKVTEAIESEKFSNFLKSAQLSAEQNNQIQNTIFATEKIRAELSVWNYQNAYIIAQALYQNIENKKIFNIPNLPEFYFLLSRVYVISAERQKSKTKKHIDNAKFLLAQIESMPSFANNIELKEDIKALRGSIINLEKGPDATLAFLAEQTNPYAIRIRLAMLLKKQDLDGAIALVEKQPLNIWWCELAVAAYTHKDRLEEAEKIIKWAAIQKDSSKYPPCIINLADALFARSLAGHEKGKGILPHDLSKQERYNIHKVVETLEPILTPIIATEKVDSGIDAAAVKIAWTANHLLGKREDVAKLTRLMYTHRPVPIEVAKSVFSSYIDLPPDLPNRLRQDHSNDLEANILATALQSSYVKQHKEAFTEAKKLIPLANTDEKKHELFKLFHQIWEEIEGDTLSECEKTIRLLISDNPKLLMEFEAAKALRSGDPDTAIQALDKEELKNDIYWLQIRAKALIQKHQLSDAVDPLFIAAKATRDPVLLRKTGDLACQTEKFDIAIWCYDRLVEMQPGNQAAHHNLASIYIFHLHDLGKAAIQFRALHRVDPKNTEYTVNLAICLAQLYHPQESLSLFNEACRQDKPEIRVVLGRAELHMRLYAAKTALASLQDFRQIFWNDPNFLLAFMNAAYAAGDDEAAHEAFLSLNKLRESGGVEPNAFKMVPADEGLEMLKKGMKDAKERTEHLHSEMLKGKMPWVWAEQLSGNAIYWGWRKRTCEMAWINDDPVNRANFCIYTTNAFHPRKSERGRHKLLPFECPPQGTKIVMDISALITLHRLGLLDMVADYFGEIIVPEGYLPFVLEDSLKMVHHQHSRQQSAEQLSKKMEYGIITVSEDQTTFNTNMVVVGEYDKSNEHRYRLIDLIRPVYNMGIISDDAYERIKMVCKKKSSVDESHQELTRFQDIFIDLTTLETVVHFDLLDAIAGYYKIHITKESCTEIRQRLESIQYQEETRKWHFDLWNRLHDDFRFRFISHTVPEGMRHKDMNPGDYLCFLGNFIARETGEPLLADDRMCQAFILNEKPETRYAAFGTDALISALLAAGKLDASKAAEYILRLMQWRYRFILPNEKILKALAEQYRSNLPGQALQEVAEYVHDCMRDMGLFGGPEKTEKGESMAMRLYVSWLSVISRFLISIWNDELFSKESVKKLTEWSVKELLPSPPCVLNGDQKVRISSLTPKVLLSYILTNSNTFVKGDRIPDGIKMLKDALKLSDNEYLHIITEILNDTQRTKF